MLLLLFLLLLLLAYLMSKEEEKTSSAIRQFEIVQSTAKQLEQEILVLIEEKERFEQEIVELESGQAQSEVMLREASRAKEKLDQIIDPSNTGEVQKHWKELVLETERAWQSLGKVTYGPTEAEKSSMVFRRSLYITEDMKKGDVLNETNLRIVRPGRGLSSKYYDILLGRKVNRDVKKGTAVKWKLIL